MNTMTDQSISDLQIQQDVLYELEWEPSVHAAHIGVSVKNGVVTLNGHVSSYADKWMAQEAAQRVQGVRAVANELSVKLPGSGQRTDEDIAIAAVNALQSNVLLPHDSIKVTVSDGWLTLEGEVKWGFQKKLAANAVRNLAGLKGVNNLIQVRPHVSPLEIQSRIEEALRRSASLGLRHIDVSVSGGKVTISGIVRSGIERKEAERAAWSAPGVWSVENCIFVEP